MTDATIGDILAEFDAMQQATQSSQQQEHPDGNGRSAGSASAGEGAPQRPCPQLHDAALYGLAGDVVRCISPHSEAHEAALLATFLLYFGNLVGRAPHALVGEKRHGTNLCVCLVGRTSGSRKGTSRSAIEALFKRLDADWLHERVLSGLSSGQGLIHEVRDPVEETNKDGETVVVDEGASDKRLVVVEEEVCAPIKMMGGEGNILSAVLRQAWDGEDLATLTRHSPLRASSPHICVLGHATQPELCKHMTEVEMANGFANRFLWLHVERSKLLPEGGGQIPWGRLVKEVHDALDHGRRCVRPVQRDDEARRLWHRVYPLLTRERGGMWGAITARAEPQVLRLSVIYALLDQSTQVHRLHLEAALALWQYCEESARVIFGEGTGNRTADRMLAAVRRAGQEGLTSTQLSEALGNNTRAALKDAALDLLLEMGLMRAEALPGRGGGRVYHAT